MAEILDWMRHLRVRPDPDGVYPHPGMWLTRGDYSEHWFMGKVMDFDSRFVAPVLCRLGFHRWITTGRRGGLGMETHCWFCGKEHNDGE